MNELADCNLYGIVDLGYVAAGGACEMAGKMIEGGVDILQLRAKTATKRPTESEIYKLLRG